nr:reverse transcriptase domain, reverse transcriptase zinc-binding domain protein [Tanacetum cinerariifolium]
ASVLVIPVGIISDIQQLIRGFLWYNGESKRGKVKVAWEDIFLPKSERGLGLRSLECAWEVLRPRAAEVTWRLKMQDKLRPWDVEDASDPSIFWSFIIVKLVSLGFKNKPSVISMLSYWKMPLSFRLYDN